MASVFISYRHVEPDTTLATQLASVLRADGHRVFIDTVIPPGAEWGERIEAELAQADYLIAMISEASAKSPMVVTEISEAHRRNTEQGRPTILPVRLGRGLELRYPLRAYIARFQHATWEGPEQTEVLFEQIKNALTVRRPPVRVASQRLEMIARVRHDWIEGILDTSLYRVARLEMGLRVDHSAVARGLDVIVQRPQEEPQPLLPGTSLLQVFDDHRGQLLILGAPGGGKTTLLLELARELLARAESDAEHPIPVVFNLSSWARVRRPLEEWMIQELHLRSDVPRKLAQDWVRHEQVLPLLDGLDEVAEDYRPACADAINEYRRHHGWVSIVVCSRTAEYAALSSVLTLPAAVVVQPLQRSQIQDYLERAGAPLEGARRALQSTPQLWELLEVPLMVSVFALAFRDRSDVPDALDEQLLFSYYVDAMFRRRAREQRYRELDMRHWLHWLASNQVRRGQSVFFLEDVVPEWFLTRRAAAVAEGVMVAATTILSSGWFYLMNFAVAYWTAGSLADDAWTIPVFSAPIPILLGIVYGRRSGPVDALRLQFPGWRQFIKSTARGALLGGLAGWVAGYSGCYAVGYGSEYFDNKFALQYAQVIAGFGMAMLGIVFGFRALLVARMQAHRLDPGALLKRSAMSAAVVFALAVIANVGAVSFGESELQNLDSTLSNLLAGARSGLNYVSWCGLLLAFERGGYFVIRHYIARLLLWRARKAPWRYTTFLDVAAERLLLRKTGGGYVFVHRKLMEYLAQLPLARTATASV